MKTTLNALRPLVLLFLIGGILACSDDDGKKESAVEFKVTPEQMEFAAKGGYSIVNIRAASDSEWSISSSADWCTVATSTATGNGHITMAVAENETAESRTATLTIAAAEGLAKTLQITQAAKAATANQIVYDLPPDSSNMGGLTSVQFSANMKTGWNIGNSLDATGGETAWGNPAVTQQLILAVKAAGFNTVRIPVAWSNFSNAANFTINTAWMDRVEQVVKYVTDNGMYAIVNIHWDGGWMQPTYAQQAYVNDRLAKMWKQIGTRFRNYDYHLLFAGTNEVMVTNNYGTPTTEYYTVQNSFNQTFVNAVRSTGGRNAYRYLVVQGFNTNIDHTVAFATIPVDVAVATKRLMMEVHYYDPYNFSLNESASNNITQWGAGATDPSKTETWANEAFADNQFQKMKTNFIDKGVAVVLGEFGAIARTDVAGSENFRKAYVSYISKSARNHGLVPIYWDNGFTGNHGMGLFNRATGAEVYPALIDAVLP